MFSEIRQRMGDKRWENGPVSVIEEVREERLLSRVPPKTASLPPHSVQESHFHGRRRDCVEVSKHPPTSPLQKNTNCC